MTGEALLSAVKLALDEREGCRVIDDARLAQMIEEANGDFRQAVYLGALYVFPFTDTLSKWLNTLIQFVVSCMHPVRNSTISS